MEQRLAQILGDRVPRLDRAFLRTLDHGMSLDLVRGRLRPDVIGFGLWPADCKPLGRNFCSSRARTSGMVGTKDSELTPTRGRHTLGFPGSFFEGGGNQMKWTYH
jgi:hypothetical protein